jgi:phenylacetate-CoA ligase
VLEAEDLDLVVQFHQQVQTQPVEWAWGHRPDWVDPYLQACTQWIPRFQALQGLSWCEIPTMNRAMVRDHAQEFFPQGRDTSRLVYHETSGTTGTKVRLYSHPLTGECYLPLLAKALSRVGVHFTSGAGRVALALVFHHTTTLTYPQVCPFLGQAAFLRLNLHPGHWKSPEDRAEYLDFLAPEVFTGTPLSLMELSKLPLHHRPKALVTTSMTLLPATRQQLQGHFQCPLIDLYSMAECRCLAARTDQGPLSLLSPDVFVEILDPQGQLCPPGQLGEIVLTGGRNPFLPLLRYRTADFAAMIWNERGHPCLTSLEGRAPVSFQLGNGQSCNNMEVTRILSDLPLTQFRLHQELDGSLQFVYRGDPELEGPVMERLTQVFGQQANVSVQSTSESLGAKWIAYSSAHPASGESNGSGATWAGFSNLLRGHRA